MEKQFLENLIEEIRDNYQKKLDLINPSTTESWPHEGNIGLVLSNVLFNSETEVFMECKVGNESRDLILFNKTQQWICQVELKLIYYQNIEGIINDLWRISTIEKITEYLEKISQKNPSFFGQNTIKDFKIYGLFIGFSYSKELHNWWNFNSPDAEADAKKYFCNGENYIEDLRGFSLLENSSIGISPQRYEKDRIWIGYFHTPCYTHDEVNSK